MDTLTSAERSIRMARIRSKDTKPELRVRRILHRLGYRYRLHRRDLPGAPDLVFPARCSVVFIHGCFWHAHRKCKVANTPKSRTSFWAAKFARNVERDRRNQKELKKKGWNVHIIWECETRNPAIIEKRMVKFLGPSRVAATQKNNYGTE